MNMKMMSKEEKEEVERLLVLTTDQVARVYSGRPGCGCGCLGAYYSDPRNIKRVLTAMKRQIKDSLPALLRVGLSSDGIGYVESDRRYYWAYLTTSPYKE